MGFRKGEHWVAILDDVWQTDGAIWKSCEQAIRDAGIAVEVRCARKSNRTRLYVMEGAQDLARNIKRRVMREC